MKTLAEKRADNARRMREWCRQNPAKMRENNLRRYGLTVAAYAAMLDGQGGVCAICNRDARRVRNGKRLNLAVDHCHTSGAVRGLLCDGCNRALGLMNDDPERMAAAAEYLRRSQ